jgi:hypothetical protein
MSERTEYFEGPLDGSYRDGRLSCPVALYFQSEHLHLVHVYTKCPKGYEWNGLADKKPDMAVFDMRIGERR